jgi:hypothetical protein
MEEANRITGGRVTIFEHHAGALLGYHDIQEGIATGLADIAYSGLSPHEVYKSAHLYGSFDVNKALAHDIETWGYLNIVNSWDYCWQEAIDMNMFMLFHPGCATYTMYSSVPIRHLSDLDGVKFMSESQQMSVFHETAGAVPVSLAWGDFYDAVTKGVVDGHVCLLGLAYDSGFLEACPYYASGYPAGPPTEVGFCGILNCSISFRMRPGLWETFSDPMKLALLQAAKYAEEFSIINWESDNIRAYNILVSRDMIEEWNVIPAAEFADLATKEPLASDWPTRAAWIDDHGADGAGQLANLESLIAMSKTELRAMWEQYWAERFANLGHPDSNPYQPR